ncbi:MAG: tetratricopeptide repeat protein [Pseudomonadota bacterium]|nr:tetratricopeptide repeat protein [Pseudomonadota bacterium]
MIALLLAWLARADAGTLAEAEDALWSNPQSAEARLAFAEALAATSGRAEEGAEALRWLLYAPSAAPIAREVLGEIVRRHPPRSGWVGIYTELGRGAEGPARDAARVRLAQLRATDRQTSAKMRARALADLRALAAGGEGIADVALGDVLFEAGDAEGARSAWLRAPVAVGALRVAMAALALGHPEEAERERQRAMAAGAGRDNGLGGSFAVAVTTNSPVAKARALLEAGFPNAAERVLLAHLGTEDGTHGGTAAAVAALLGDLRLERGDGIGAASAYTDALQREATPEHRARLVRALLASGRADDAAAALAGGPVSAEDRAAIELTLALARALATPSPEDDLPAGTAAFGAAPDEAGTAATYGRLLLAAGREAEAVTPLARAVSLRPEDTATRGILLGAAIRAGDTRTLDAAASAVVHAPDEATRAEQLDALAGLLLASANAQKAAGSPATARTSALVALAVRPDAPPVLHAVAGVLWQEGRREAALALYAHAADLDPADLDARVCAAQLTLALGRDEEVEGWLAQLPADAPQASALRETLLQERQARAARAETDPGVAEAQWKLLIARWPRDARFLHGLADVYLGTGRSEEALAIQRAAVSLDPDDPWNRFGLIQALLALGRTADAVEALDALPETVPVDVARERDRLRARLSREAGDRAREAGDLVAAQRHYEASYALEPEVWTSIALAGTLVAVGDPAGGLVRFREALASDGDDGVVDTVASNGEAGALEALGQGPAALAVLEALAARRPEADTEQAREELRARIAVAEADALRRDGRLAEAEKALAELAVEVGNQPMVQAAWAALLLDLRRPKDAVIAAGRALQREPQNQWALDVAREAGRACRCSARVAPLFQVAIASGGPPTLAAELRWVRVAAATEAALSAQAKHRAQKATDAMREAATLAGDDAQSLVILAAGEKSFGRPGRAHRALTRAHAADPANVEAIVALAEDLAARGRWGAAIGMAERAWEADPDSRLAELLTRLRAARPGAGPRRAEAAARNPAKTTIAAPFEGPKPPPDRGVVATVGFGVLLRSGVSGIGKELATYVPIHLGPPPIGPVRLDVEAVLLRVENGVDTSWAVAPSLGISTPDALPWGAWGRLGTSPIGFSEGAYPVWHVGGRGRLGAPLAFGVETGRAPLLDSYASWVGAADLSTGEPFGHVHHTWFGGWAGVGAPWGTDVGLLGRLGQSEGIGLDPVGRAEVVAWVGQRIGTPQNNVRIGGEGVAFSHQKQVGGFGSGQGAFYSPPIYAVATGRIDVRWHGLGERLSVCGGVGAGMQHAGGGSSLYFAPGSAFTHNGRLSVEWNVSGKWGVALQGGWLKAGPWHQETGMLRFGHNLGGPPPLTTFATPAAGLWYQGEPC